MDGIQNNRSLFVVAFNSPHSRPLYSGILGDQNDFLELENIAMSERKHETLRELREILGRKG